MARLFDDAQSDWLYINQAVHGSMPLAITCWFNADNDVDTQGLITLLEKDDAGDYYRLSLGIVVEDFKLVVGANATTGSYQDVAITIPVTLNNWHHGCGIFVSPTDRRVLLNGGSKGVDTTDGGTPADLDRVSLGNFGRVTDPVQFLSGHIAEVAIYDLSAYPGATASDKADNFEKILPSLAKGFTPLLYPLGLKAYWPLIRGLNDKVGGFNLTVSGTTVSPHEISMKRPCGVL